MHAFHPAEQQKMERAALQGHLQYVLHKEITTPIRNLEVFNQLAQLNKINSKTNEGERKESRLYEIKEGVSEV